MARTTAARALASVAALAAAAIVVASVAPALAAESERSWGAERVATAARIAEVTFPTGADGAVVARSDAYPDALAASALAGAVGGPVLLSVRGDLSSTTAAALDDLGVDRVYALGGRAALADPVVADLARDYTTTRLAGPDRFATAAAIATEAVRIGGLGSSQGRTTVLIASGEGFADALTASPSAWRNRLPVLLVRRDALPGATRAALVDLDPQGALVLGGTAAISQQVEDEIEALGIQVTRVAGRSRAETSARFGAYAGSYLQQDGQAVLLSRGDTFPDALTGGPMAGAMDAPIILTQAPTMLGSAAENYLEGRCGELDVVRALGGTAAVSAAVLDAGTDAATDCAA